MKEVDVEYPQSPDLVANQVDGIAGGIMDLMEDANPNASGTVIPAPAEDPADDGETPSTDGEEPSEPEGDDPEKYTIKWQGQEREVTQAELLDLAQKGFDYTQKTQALAQQRDQLAPYEGLAKLMQSDPVKAGQIAAILSGQAPQQQQAAPKQFDDPIEQLKWETKQDILAEVRREQAQALVPLHRQAALNQVRQQVQADPDYREIHQQIVEMVQSQPPAIQKTMFQQLDQDPQAYVEAFQFFKNKKTQQPPAVPKPVKKETRAPILDSGGVAAPEGVASKEKAQRLSKQKAAALRTGDNDALANWLQDSGALEHLY